MPQCVSDWCVKVCVSLLTDNVFKFSVVFQTLLFGLFSPTLQLVASFYFNCSQYTIQLLGHPVADVRVCVIGRWIRGGFDSQKQKTAAILEKLPTTKGIATRKVYQGIRTLLLLLFNSCFWLCVCD